MHHFLYPTQDSYISNLASDDDKNFGLDELLTIGVTHNYAKVLSPIKTYTYSNEYVVGASFENFTGKYTGSFTGTITDLIGTIIGSSTRFTASYLSGSMSGSIDGYETGSTMISSDFSGSVVGFSGSVSSSIVAGVVSGSMIADCFSTFTGEVTGAIGAGTGYITGTEIKTEQNITTVDRQYINRTLIKFDLTTISQSIVNGDIEDPVFYLKLKSVKARELPTTYKIHAFAISQSWDQGDGYYSDRVHDDGVSWNWRDVNSGSAWFSPYVESIITASVDYINDFSYISESFTRGGGTWYNISCSQSFSYEVSDINMDVTPIVNNWLNSTIPNEGFILVYSGETELTSSNTQMQFFSKNTNTIYIPTLDVAWDDSSWITGSTGTGSVIITTIQPRLSGSMVSPVTITGVIASGSFAGNAYLITGVGNSIDSGSTISAIGTSNTIANVPINGDIVGTSSLDAAGVRHITASFNDGDFVGCEIYANYSSSMITGVLSGSFTDTLFTSHFISGSIPSSHTQNQIAYQYSPVEGVLLGDVVSTDVHSGVFTGVVTSGLLTGATMSIPFTGSYSYLTSSMSITSSVEITGSSLSQVNTEYPFTVILHNLKRKYNSGDIPKISIFAREQFPLKSFERAAQQAVYTIPKVLPSSSYYAIKDNETEEMVVDFDTYTKISSDLTGNYFDLDTTGLAQERYYKILIRVNCYDGNSYTFDSLDLFKIQR